MNLFSGTILGSYQQVLLSVFLDKNIQNKLGAIKLI